MIASVNSSFLVLILASAVLYGTPLLFAALGELLAERSGVLNLGVEGMMLVGAVMGFWAVQRLDAAGGVSLTVALAVAALAGALMALIHAFLVITLRANQIVSGLALTIFAGAAGLSSYLANDLSLSGVPADHAFTSLDVLGLGEPARRRPDPVRPVRARLPVVAARRRDRAVPRADAGRPERASRRRVARRRRRDGHRRDCVPLRAHARGRCARGDRRRVLQLADHARRGSTASPAAWVGSRSRS